MKRIIIMLTLALVTQLSIASHFPTSVLNLRLNDNSGFRVALNGDPTGTIGSRHTLTNLREGRHLLQIYRVNFFRGREITERIFKGYVTIERNTESFVVIFPELQRLRYESVVALRGNNRNPHAPRPGRPGHYYQQPTTWEPASAPQIYAMNPNDFSMLKQTISNASFENTRISILKQALGYNYFTTAQVRELMSLFWFENSKLEVAKLAYPRTIDQHNYYMINNEFSFSSSVNELGSYIAMR